jgi:hypothetical protein
VTVDQDAPKLLMDLGPVFGNIRDLHPEDGLRFSMLGNTNSGLVTGTLSEAELTLTFAPGRYGTATLAVAATDANDVCAQATLAVTVRPRLFTLPPSKPVSPAGTSPLPTGVGYGTSVGSTSGASSTPAGGGGAGTGSNATVATNTGTGGISAGVGSGMSVGSGSGAPTASGSGLSFSSTSA